MTLFSRPTFDNYIVGKGNTAAFLAAVEVGKYPGKRYNPLFIYGSTGTGKTHLLNAIAEEIAISDPSAQVYINGYRSFTARLRKSLEADNGLSMREELATLDAFLLDDVCNDGMWVTMQQEMISWIEKFVNEERQLVFTSDQPPLQLVPIEKRFLSRIQRGLIVPVGEPDRCVKEKIITLLLDREGIRIDNDALACLGGLPVTDIRELVGMLNRLVVSRNADGVDFSKPWLIKTLQTMVKNGEIRRLPIVSLERPFPVETAEPGDEAVVRKVDLRGEIERPLEPLVVQPTTKREGIEAVEEERVAEEPSGPRGVERALHEEDEEDERTLPEKKEPLGFDELNGFIMEWDREEDRLLDEL